MPPTTANIEIRKLIRKLASTPDGYCRADSEGLLGASRSDQNTSRMIEAGDLFRVKVYGHLTRYVKTQKMADALKTKLLGIKNKRIRASGKPIGPRQIRFGALRTCVATASDNPNGTSRLECAPEQSKQKPFSKCVSRMIALGLLFSGKVAGFPTRYFGNQADAEAWKTVARPKVRLYVPRPPKPTKEKVVKAKAVKPAFTAPKPLFNIARKPYSPPSPRKPVVIIWPEGVKHTIIATPVPRFAMISHSFVHVGMGAM